jgi:hypothetical protein
VLVVSLRHTKKKDIILVLLHFSVLLLLLLRYLEDLLDDDSLDDLRERDSVAGLLFLVMDPVLFEPRVFLDGDPVEEERVDPINDQRQQEG